MATPTLDSATTPAPGADTAQGTKAEASSETPPKTLYRHTKRPEWGVAVLAWEKEKRRAYQFEDGKLRKFKKGYYALMQPAENVERPRDIVANSLQEAAKVKKARLGKPAAKGLTPVCSFKDQLSLFLQLFPKGFQDERWLEEHRGSTSARTLKRHRDPAIREVQEALGQDRAEELMAEGSYEELMEAVCEALAGTNLVPISAVKTLRGLNATENQRFAETTVRLLHGEGDFDPRFKDYLKLLKDIYGSRPSWRVATALPALMSPNKQVCVRRSVFLRQAASISPDGEYTKRARAGSYRNFRRVAFAVRKRLQAEGHEPSDLLDVHDFIWLTLRNAALEHLQG